MISRHFRLDAFCSTGTFDDKLINNWG